MKGAKLDEYIVDSTNCLNAIDDTAGTFADFVSLVKDHKQPDSKVSMYPDIILSTTDVLSTFSPLARLCFQSSMEARDDMIEYINNFDSFDDYITQFGTAALAHYFSLRETLNTITYAMKELKNSTEAAFFIGKFVTDLFFFTPAPRPQTEFLNFEEFQVDEEPMYVDDGTKEDLTRSIDNSYEAMYVFLTSLNFARGINLDSCKYYATRMLEKIYDGKSIIQRGKQGDKAEGVFTIIDSLEFIKGSVKYCVDSSIDVVNSCKYVIKNFSPRTIPERIFKNFFHMLSDATSVITSIHYEDQPTLLKIVADILKTAFLNVPPVA